MANLKAQIESHLPESIAVGSEEKYLSWLNEAQRILVYLVDEKDGRKYLRSLEVPESGLDIELLRFITPHKNGISAGMYPQRAYYALNGQGYTGIYQASPSSPAAVIHDGKIYVFPDGGHVSAFGVIKVEDLTEDRIKSMPLPFTVAAIYYVAIQAYKEYLRDDNLKKELSPAAELPDLTLEMPSLTKEDFLETLTLGMHPNAPDDPVITADEASTPEVSDTQITSPEITDADGTKYNKEDLTLDFSRIDADALDDDIEMLQGEAQILQNKIQEAQSNMQDELNRVNTMIQGFQSQVQHSLEQGRLTSSAKDSTAQLKLNQELTNAQNKLQAAIEEKRIVLQKYQSEIQSISTENQNKIAEFQANVSVWAQKNDLNSVEFQNAVQFTLNKYQADINAKLQDYQNKLAEVNQNNQTRDSKIEGYLRSIMLLTEQFNQAVQAYMRSIEGNRHIPAPVDPEVQGQ